MGQCGLGHSQGPVTSPKLVTALRAARVQQISAGTSHSLAWTAVPSDRYTVDDLLHTYIHTLINLYSASTQSLMR